MSYRIYFVGVLNIGEKLNKSPIAKIKSSPINLPVRYLQLRASHGIHMKTAHTVLYMNKQTQTYGFYPAMDISCMSLV